MIEQWQKIQGYENDYLISSFGEVKSIKNSKDKILKKSKNTKGYFIVSLCKNGKTKSFQIHQLVAIHFLNHIPNGLSSVINHIDFNKNNNNVSNLEIVTNRENSNRKHLKSTSQYTGVSWDKNKNKWQSQIKKDGKTIFLGRYNNELDASIAYQNELNKL